MIVCKKTAKNKNTKIKSIIIIIKIITSKQTNKQPNKYCQVGLTTFVYLYNLGKIK